MNHRALQRTLFRMQCDADFARRVLADDEAVWRETGLGAPERELLLATTPAGLAADPGDTRKQQVLGNVATEFVLSIASAAAAGLDDFLESFLSSAEFHGAIASEARLPLAFADYAKRRAQGVASHALVGLVDLEGAMVRARRFAGPNAQPAAGTVQLVPGSELVRLTAGLAAHADALRANLDAGLPAPTFRALQGSELVLVAPRKAPHAFALGGVHVENLAPPVDQVLERALEPLDRAARAQLATNLGASPEDLESFVAELLAEGLLIGG